jgi:hypothetical protein
MWEEEEKEEEKKNMAYLIPMMNAIKTAFLSDARELALEKRKNKRTSQRESRLDGHGIELKFPPPPLIVKTKYLGLCPCGNLDLDRIELMIT